MEMLNNMRNIFNEIKWAYQRVVRGYDDRIYWGFDSYFIQIIPALKEFCENYLSLNKERLKLNPERVRIFKKTLKLIKECEENYFINYESDDLDKLFEYVGKHLGYYWY